MRCSTISLVAVVLTLIGPVAPRAGAPPQVEYRDDRVTIRAQESAVTDILDQLRQQSGAELRGEPPPTGPVTLQVEAVPVREALERLLGERSFTLTYGQKGRLKVIELKGGPQAARNAPPEEPEARPGGLPRKVVWDGVAHVFAVPKVVPVTGPLAEALGSNRVFFVHLMQAAADRCEDRLCRKQAWRAGLRAMEEDQELRNAFLGATGLMDDEELTAFARAMAAQTPDGAEDIVKQIVRDSRIPEIRTRARVVLLRLRQERTAMTAER
jgi:hypothetical protein